MHNVLKTAAAVLLATSLCASCTMNSPPVVTVPPPNPPPPVTPEPESSPTYSERVLDFLTRARDALKAAPVK